jgi:hypothetical protein
MSFRNMEQQQQAIAAAHLENAKKALVAFVYQKFPTLVVCDANSRMIVELVERWGGPDIMPTPEAFLSMLDENGPEAMSMLAQQPEAVTRRQLADQIIALLAAKGKGHDAFTLRQEEKRLALLSIPALRARLADLQVKAKMASTDVATLKNFVAESRRDQRRYQGYPDMPRQIWDGTKHIPLNATTIKAMDAWEIRKLARLYSDRQLNDRIQEG